MKKSRQLQLQHKRIADGLCRYCSKPLDRRGTICSECSQRIIKSNRKRCGHKPWKLGTRGQIPLNLSPEDANAIAEDYEKRYRHWSAKARDYQARAYKFKVKAEEMRGRATNE